MISTKRLKIAENENYKYRSANIPLLFFDLMLLPINIIRMILIYFWGSKYNIKGFQFLDVIMHANNPYFNQEDCRVVDTIGKDYRVVIRDDSRIFPMDINRYFEFEAKNNCSNNQRDSQCFIEKNVKQETNQITRQKAISNTASKQNRSNIYQTKERDLEPKQENKVYNDCDEVIVGSTTNKKNTKWDISTEECKDDDDKPNLQVNKGDKNGKLSVAEKIKRLRKLKRLHTRKEQNKDTEVDESDSDSESEVSDSDLSDSDYESEVSNDSHNDSHNDSQGGDSQLSTDIDNIQMDSADNQSSQINTATNDSIDDNPINDYDKDIKGVNYFGANDEENANEQKIKVVGKKGDILDSIRDELNSVFDD